MLVVSVAVNPVPAAVICKVFVLESNAGVKEVRVATGETRSMLQLFAGHVASDEAAKTTTTAQAV